MNKKIKKIICCIFAILLVLPIVILAEGMNDGELGLEILDKIKNEELVTIKSVEPTDAEWGPDLYFVNYLRKNLSKSDDNSQYSNYPCTDVNNCEFSIYNSEITENNGYKVQIKYDDSEINEEIKKDVEAIAEKITNNSTIKYPVKDINLIDYYLNVSNLNLSKSFMLSNMINYSDEFRTLVDNTNMDFFIDYRLGDSSPNKTNYGGYLGIYNEGNLYKVLPSDIYVVEEKIIYIDETTEDTTEEYMQAAKKRINDFYGKEIVNINNPCDLKEEIVNYLRQFDESATNDELYIQAEEIINDEEFYASYNMLPYTYDVIINETTYKFIIVKDSTKLAYPNNLHTIDYASNLMIKSDTTGIPLDTKVSVNEIEKNTDKFELIAKDNEDINIYTIYDIELFSNNANKKIEKLDNGNFKVYLPMEYEYKDKNLEVYFINENGEKEIHEVKIEDGYLVFETNHFSEYILGEKATINNNPDTSDNLIGILMNMFLLLVVIGLGILYLKKEKNKEIN